MSQRGFSSLTLAQNLGARLGIARRNVGLSQKEVSARTGTTQSGVSSWESGRKHPTVLQLAQLAEIYGCPTDMLLFGIMSTPVATFVPGADPRLTHQDRKTSTYRDLLLATAKQTGTSHAGSS